MVNYLSFIKKSLGLKILLALSLSVAVVMGVVIYLNTKNQQKQIKESMKTFGRELKFLAYAGLRHPMSVVDSPSVEQQLLDIKEIAKDTEIAVCDFRQRIVFATNEDKINKDISHFIHNKEAISALRDLLQTGAPYYEKYFEEEVDGKRYLITVHSLLNDKECYHCHGSLRRILGGMIVRQSTDEIYSAIAELRNRTILISFLGIGAVICMIYFMIARLVTWPIVDLAQKAERLASGDLSVSVEVKTEDSIGTLGKSFNYMVKRLKDLYDRLSQFNDELKDEVAKRTMQLQEKTLELKLLYSMTERLSKTIDIEQLKIIVIQIIKEAIDADEIEIIFHKKYKGYQASKWSRDDDAVIRKKLCVGDSVIARADAWLNGGMKEPELSQDGKLIYLPIEKSGTHLALIVIRKSSGTFYSINSELLRTMSSHISVAFENALLYHIAITDELTGLYTKRHLETFFSRKFSEYEKSGEKTSILMIDIDDFKKVNDTFGHLVGDSVLKDVAKRIIVSLRDADLAFRYGGEELTIVLHSLDASNAAQVAERIREDISNYIFEARTLNLHLSVSIGISTWPDNAHTPRDLILTADQALYKAKKAGKNRTIISDARV